VVSGTVNDVVRDAIERRVHGRRSAIELTVFIVFMQMTIRLPRAPGRPAPSDHALDELWDDLRRPAIALPDYRAGAGRG
jgi:hypothetical protein